MGDGDFHTPSMSGPAAQTGTPPDETTLFTPVVPDPIPDQQGPQALADTKEVPVQSEEGLITTLNGELDDALMAREVWRERQTRWYKQRYGIRPPKTFPWPGASNLHIPLTDKNIRKLKPIYVALIFSVFPVCTFTPENEEVFDFAEQIDKTYHWILNNRMKVFEDTCLAVDIMLERGFSILKPVYVTKYRPVEEMLDRDEIPSELLAEDAQEGFIQWLAQQYDYDLLDEEDQKRIDRVVKQVQDGTQDITVPVMDLEYDAPAWIVRKPEDVIVPADTAKLKDARMIFDVFKMTGKDLRDEVAADRFKQEVVEYLLEHKPEGMGTPSIENTASVPHEFGTLDEAQRNRTGVDMQHGGTDTYDIVEAYFYFDFNHDGIDEKVVMTYCKQYPKEALRFIVYNYRHGQWPFVKLYFDLVDYGHYSHRGIPEMIHMPQAGVNKAHNDRADRNTLATALTFLYTPGGFKPSNQRFIPGQHVARRSQGDVEVMQIPDVTFPLEKEELQLKAYAEEYLGNPDFTQTSAVGQTGNKPRTAFEINQAGQMADKVMTLDVQIFQNAMRAVHEQTFALLVQFGPKEYLIRLQGESPFRITRDVLRNRFGIAPNGRLWNSSPMLELAKAENRLIRFQGDIWINQHELRKQYLIKDDPAIVGKLLRSQEEVMLEMQAQAAAQAQQAAMKGSRGKPGAGGSAPTGGGATPGPKESLTAQAAGVK